MINFKFYRFCFQKCHKKANYTHPVTTRLQFHGFLPVQWSTGSCTIQQFHLKTWWKFDLPKQRTSKIKNWVDLMWNSILKIQKVLRKWLKSQFSYRQHRVWILKNVSKTKRNMRKSNILKLVQKSGQYCNFTYFQSLAKQIFQFSNLELGSDEKWTL